MYTYYNEPYLNLTGSSALTIRTRDDLNYSSRKPAPLQEQAARRGNMRRSQCFSPHRSTRWKGRSSYWLSRFHTLIASNEPCSRFDPQVSRLGLTAKAKPFPETVSTPCEKRAKIALPTARKMLPTPSSRLLGQNLNPLITSHRGLSKDYIKVTKLCIYWAQKSFQCNSLNNIACRGVHNRAIDAANTFLEPQKNQLQLAQQPEDCDTLRSVAKMDEHRQHVTTSLQNKISQKEHVVIHPSQTGAFGQSIYAPAPRTANLFSEAGENAKTVTLKLITGTRKNSSLHTSQARPGSDSNSPATGACNTLGIKARVGSTLLEVAHENNINVDGTCSGRLECSTCHCVLGSLERYQELEDVLELSTNPGDGADLDLLRQKRMIENDLLSNAFAVEEKSRLSCQVRVTAAMDGMEIRYPNMIEKVSGMNSSTANLKDADGECTEPTAIEGSASQSPASSTKRGLKERSPGAMAQKLELDYSVPVTAIGDQSGCNTEIHPRVFRNITKSFIAEVFEKYGKNGSNRQRKFLMDNLHLYETLAHILPFRTNNYVVEELIDWTNVPDDPIFQLNFPQPGMLLDKDMTQIEEAKRRGARPKEIRILADAIRAQLNPHPAKQKEMNVPSRMVEEKGGGGFEAGMQHKYRETVLFFPSESQYCHSYCTYCFRWAQFVGCSDLQFASNDLEQLMSYLRRNKSVTDLLITGGDPMVLNSRQLARYLYPIANDVTLDHVQNIRIGSKSLAYWPYKYVTDADADDVLRVLENVVKSGKKHVHLMAHFTHPRELETPVVREAIRRIRMTGVTIRAQAPLVNGINNDAGIWATMWKEQVKLGIIPYYMFVERDTGAKDWFGVPLERCLQVYNEAIARVPGLARTARGPSMSCAPGKLALVGLEWLPSMKQSTNATLRLSRDVPGQYEERVFVLKFLQARNPEWINRTLFAEYDPKAKWLSDLKPAFGQERFFFEQEHDEMEIRALQGVGSSGQMYV